MAQRPLLPAVVATLLLLLLVLDPMVAKPLPGIADLVLRARQFADNSTRHKGVPVKDRIAVIYLHNGGEGGEGGIENEAHRGTTLYKSCMLLMKYIGAYTPLDIYVFVPEANAPQDPGTHAFTALFPNMAVMPIPANHWHLHHKSSFLQDSHLEINDRHRMGQWRLQVQFTFGALMGYEYVWQIDMDSYMLGPHRQNLVEQLRANKALIAGHQICWDPPREFNGLPELARSFIQMHSGEYAHIRYNPDPAGRPWNVSSALWKHCRPPNIHGLHTGITNMPGQEDSGFDGAYIYGNFLIIKSELWLRPLVQDFVQLAVMSGGVYRSHWIEQPVETFVWLMFAKEEEFLLLREVKFMHRRPYLNDTEFDAAMNGELPEPWV